MKKKLIIEIFLLLLILTISILIFSFYFNKDEKVAVIDKTKIKESDDKPLIDEGTSSVIKNINYSFVDDNDNNYKIVAEFGKIFVDQPNVIKMTNVTAFAYLKNNAPVKIVSKFADYNKTNHETSFYENVNLKYLNHDAKSENLDLLFIKNIILMYNNLIYINEDIKLLADKFLFNLETKDAKFFMNDTSEKVKVIKY